MFSSWIREILKNRVQVNWNVLRFADFRVVSLRKIKPNVIKNLPKMKVNKFFISYEIFRFKEKIRSLASKHE